MPILRSTGFAVVIALFTAADRASAQDSRRSLDLTVGGVGISIGDSRRVNGLRINYRDSRLDEVNGINATIWTPFRRGHGDITGLSLGLPATGGRDVRGLLLAGFGAEVTDRFSGIGVSGLGMGVGGNATGIIIGGLGSGVGGSMSGALIGGFGAGVGGDVEGLAIGGLGFGVGGRATGILIGGLGAGIGGDFRGLALGGLGFGAGGRFEGIMIAGLGAAAGGGGTGVLIGGLGAGVGSDFEGLFVAGLGGGFGGRLRGIAITGMGMGVGSSFNGLSIAGIGGGVGGSASGVMVNGVGMGVGGDATGIFINGFGMGAGGRISFLTINGFGVGAPQIHGAAFAGGVIGTPHAKGLMAAGFWLRVREEEGDRRERFRRSGGALLEGVGISAFNQVKGHQKGLTIGLLNYAWSLSGVQLGLLNIVRDNPPGRKVLPVVNWGSNR